MAKVLSQWQELQPEANVFRDEDITVKRMFDHVTSHTVPHKMSTSLSKINTVHANEHVHVFVHTIQQKYNFNLILSSLFGELGKQQP